MAPPEGLPAPVLVVAGIHDKDSLGWSAAEAWLNRSEDHQVLATVRSVPARQFVETKSEELDGRVRYLSMDWAEPGAGAEFSRILTGLYEKDRPIAGVIHAIAAADPSNFNTPPDELDPEVYVKAFSVTTASFLRVIQGSRHHLCPGGGVVTFGFGESGKVVEGYGGAMSVAKAALTHMVAVQGHALGRADPHARTLEIVTGYIPTHSGKGVALGQSQSRRTRPKEVVAQFAETSPLQGTSAEQQRIAAGELAVSFVIDPMWSQTTGGRIASDGGWSLGGPQLFPKVRLRSN